MKFLNFLLIFFTVFVFGQNIGFSLLNNQKKEIIPFRFINNLIFIPVNINGVELTIALRLKLHRVLVRDGLHWLLPVVIVVSLSVPLLALRLLVRVGS